MDIVINEVTYSLPSRSFLIDFSLSQKRQLPVVKEFVVRYLFIQEMVEPDLIAGFFGFSTSELYNVLEDLSEERLVEWDSSSVKLSQYAAERFEEVDGKAIPRFFEVSDEKDVIKFDLLSYRLITERSDGYNSPSNIEVKLSADSYKHSTQKAQRAFDEQFVEYLEKIKQVDVFNDSSELYKINSVVQKDEVMLPIKVRYFIDSESVNHPYVEYADSWLEDWDKDKEILSEINISVNEDTKNKVNQNQEITAREYIAGNADPILGRYISGGAVNYVDLFGDYEESRGVIDLKTRMLVGNIYIKENRDKIFGLLNEGYGEKNKIPAKGGLWNVWTDNKIWGRTIEVESFVRDLKLRFDSRYKPGQIALCLSADSFQEGYALEKIYKRANLPLQGISIPYVNTQTEILWIPGVLFTCLFHIEDNNFGNQTIPVGYATTDPDRIAQVASNVANWIKDESSTNDYFERRGVKEEKKVFTNIILKLLEDT